MIASFRPTHRDVRAPLPASARVLSVALSLLVVGLFARASGTATAEDSPGWVSITSGLHAQGVSGLRIHRKEPGVMFAHVHGMGAARSKDGGKTWERIMTGVKPVPDPRSSIRISLDPTKARWIYMVVEGQVYKSVDSGDHWKNITTGALASYSRDRRSTAYLGYELAVNQGKSIHLVLGTRGRPRYHGGVFESRDGGQTWEQLAGSNLGRSGMGPEGYDTFMVRLDPKTDKNLLAAGREHAWRSTDRGQSWSLDDPGGEGLHDIRSITDPSAIKNIYLADTRGIWESRGISKKWAKKPLIEGDAQFVVGAWKRLYAIFADQGVAISEGSRHRKWHFIGPDHDGYVGAGANEIVVHPRDRRTFYVLSNSTGMHVTTDGGETIAPIEGSNVPTVVPGMVDAAVHPAGKHIALSVTEEGVVFSSVDGGQAWEQAGRLGQRPHRLVACPGAGTWYATGRRLMRSTDDGRTWVPFFSPVDAEDRIIDVQHVVIDGSPTVLALSERTGGIVKSSDGGKSWTQVKAPPISDGTWASALAINPGQPMHMIMATRTLRLVWSDQDTDGGVFETLDGGAHWADITRNLKPTRKEDATARQKKASWNYGRLVLIDPVAGVMLYGADGGGLFARSLPNKAGVFADNDWWPVTPKQMPKTTYGVHAHQVVSGVGGEAGTSRLTLQLFRPAADTSGLVQIDGIGLRAMYDYACPSRRKQVEAEKGEDLAEPGGWQELKSPGHALASLHAIPSTVAGLIGSDRDHGKGIVFHAADVKRVVPDEPGKPAGEPAGPAKLEPPEGMWGFSASADQDVNVWELRSKKRAAPLRGHAAEVYAVRMANDETLVATGGADRKVRLWDGSQLESVGVIDAPGAVTSLFFGADSEKLYAGCDSWQIVVIDKENRKALGLLEGSAGSVLCLAAGEDATKLYSGGKDGRVRIWDTDQRKELMSIKFGAPVLALAVSPDGGRIYVGGQGNTLKVFDALGKLVTSSELPQTVITTMCLGPEGKLLYVGGEGGVMALDSTDLKLVRKHTGPAKAVLCLDVSADGVWIFGGDEDNGLWLWQHDIEAARWNNPGAHAGAVFSVALSPDETEVGNSEVPAAGPKDGANPPGDTVKPPKEGDPKPGDK